MRWHALIQAMGGWLGVAQRREFNVWRSAVRGGMEVRGMQRAGLDRLANRLRLPPEMKQSTGQRRRLSEGAQPAAGMDEEARKSRRLEINHRSIEEKIGATRTACGLCLRAQDERPVTSQQGPFVASNSHCSSHYGVNSGCKASQCAVAARTRQRENPVVAVSAPLRVTASTVDIHQSGGLFLPRLFAVGPQFASQARAGC